MRASTITTKRPAIEAADFKTLLAFETSKLRRSGEDFNAEAQRLKDTVAPINKRGAHLEIVFDLGDANFTTPGYIEKQVNGWGLTYSIQGSAPGGVLDFDFDGGGTSTQCEPGAQLTGYFSRVVIKRNVNSIQSGTVRLRIQTQPDVHYGELAKGQSAGSLGNPGGLGVGPAGVLTQAYNSAAGNIPTAATDGLSLGGVRGARAIVVSAVGSTILAGELHWWQFDTADALWGETSFLQVYALATNNRVWFPGDWENWVPEGRIYPEWRGGTNSAGSGAFKIILQTWGS